MIGRLHGKLLAKAPPLLLIDVGGVGYECEAPMSTFYKLPKLGEAVTVLTHLVVREDAHLLYAFASATERQLFRDLIRVSGIGPKIALAVLSGVSVEEFWATVREAQVGRLTKVPGIGRKTAERMVMELRDRAGATDHGLPAGMGAGAGGSGNPLQEARAALEALGYKPAEAQRLTDAVSEEGWSAEQIIREALKRAVR